MPSAILTWHSLDRTGRLYSTPPDVFRMQVEALLEGGLRFVSLDQVTTADGSVALTFDDGHCNFLDTALPILLEYKIPSTLFVVSGRCGGDKNWPSCQPFSTKDDELLSWDQLRQAASAGVAIGAHSVHHPNLVTLSESDAARELRDSRLEIEDRLGRPVPWFAYPYGHSNPRLRALAAREFKLACGVDLSLARKDSDPFDLPRIFEFYLRHPFWLRHLTAPLGRTYLAARRLKSA